MYPHVLRLAPARTGGENSPPDSPLSTPKKAGAATQAERQWGAPGSERRKPLQLAKPAATVSASAQAVDDDGFAVVTKPKRAMGSGGDRFALRGH